MEGLKPYPAYKDSGLPWLGRVPEHWDSKRGKVLFHKVVRPVRAEDGVITCFRDGVVTLRKNRRLCGFTEAIFELGYQGVRKGDLVIHAMDAFAGAVGVSDSDGKGTPVYAVCQPQSEANSYYYAHVVREMARTQWIQALSRGIRERSTDFRYETLGRQFLVVPPIEEQAAIVRYLDHATRKIDKAIRAKRRIIALLNEQKQTIIHCAVTRGLDPNVPLKDSGIPWLEQMPAHWDVFPLKALCTIQSGVTLGKFYDDEQLKVFPYLRVANVQAGHLSLGTVKTLKLPVSEGMRAKLRVGDVLMTEGGDPDKLGRGCVWHGEVEDCVHQNHVFAVRPDNARLRSQFLATVLASAYAKNYFQHSAKQTTNLASTNKTTIGRFRVPLPALDEQDATLEKLESSLLPVAEAISRTEREITLLREYRTRLIADVVTGKLDVRAAATRLPEIAVGMEVSPDSIDDESETMESESE